MAKELSKMRVEVKSRVFIPRARGTVPSANEMWEVGIDVGAVIKMINRQCGSVYCFIRHMPMGLGEYAVTCILKMAGTNVAMLCTGASKSIRAI
jgi:hypothetical protein